MLPLPLEGCEPEPLELPEPFEAPELELPELELPELELPEPFEAPAAVDAPVLAAFVAVLCAFTLLAVAPVPARFIIGAQRRMFILSRTIFPSGQAERPSVPSSPQAASAAQPQTAMATGMSLRARRRSDAVERFI